MYCMYLWVLCTVVITMSEVLRPLDKLKFESNVKIGSEPSIFLNRQYKQNTSLTLIIPNKLFLEIENYSREFQNLSPLDVLLSQVSYLHIERSDRLSKRVQSIISEVKNEAKRRNATKGSPARKKYLESQRELAIYEEELRDVSDLTRNSST